MIPVAPVTTYRIPPPDPLATGRLAPAVATPLFPRPTLPSNASSPAVIKSSGSLAPSASHSILSTRDKLDSTTDDKKHPDSSQVSARSAASLKHLSKPGDSHEKKGSLLATLAPWAVLSSLGVVGWVLPLAVLPITEAMATNFVWNFNGQDLVGMGAPRVGVSLKRGAKEYDESQDPEAAKRHGLSHTLYVAGERLKRANWANLHEEMNREIASAPGMMLLSLIAFNAIKPVSRMTDWPIARRAIELPHQTIEQYGRGFEQFVQTHPAGQPFPQISKAFFQQLWASPQNAAHQALLDQPVTVTHDFRKSAVDPEYAMSDRMVNRLVRDNVDGIAEDLQGFRPKGWKPGSQYAVEPVVQRQTTLRQLVEGWSSAMADHVALDLDGTKRAIWDPEAIERNATAQARLNYYTRGIDQAVTLLNRERAATHGNQLNHWGITLADNTQSRAVGGRTGLMREMDKFRDWMVSVARKAEVKPQTLDQPVAKEALLKVTDSVTRQLKGQKLIAALGLTASTSYYMWWLSHAIQKGREYPANATVSLSATAIGGVATATANTLGGPVVRPIGATGVPAGNNGTLAPFSPLSSVASGTNVPVRVASINPFSRLDLNPVPAAPRAEASV